MQDSYAARLAAENSIYRDCLDVHRLPDIFHYWSNRYVRPKLEAFGFSSPDEMFRKYLTEQCRRGTNRPRRFLSLGSGNCNLEIEIAAHLRAGGRDDFVIDCLDVNPAMLERGRMAAAEQGVVAHMYFVQTDLNEWSPPHEYDAAIANQTLHHIVNLERLFDRIRDALTPSGVFVVSEIIGRNGHQRWPEALAIVQEFWRELPPSYRFNHGLHRYEEVYENWDCSKGSFEAVRSQDILPLLLGRFHFQLFAAFANVIDPFVDRAFGTNFDAASPWDRSFIDRVHQRDEAEIASGCIKPTHMLAVVGKIPLGSTVFHEPLSPEACVRTGPVVEVAGPQSADRWNWPHSTQSELETACQKAEGVHGSHPATKSFGGRAHSMGARTQPRG